MMDTRSIGNTLNARRVLILDGGLATALEEKGHNLNHSLWSGLLLQSDPQAIQDVHTDFYKAGAHVAITASYQASVPGLQKHLNISAQEAKQLIQSSVKLASAARDKILQSDPSRALYVAGGVGPYGAFLANGAEYTGEYGGISEEGLVDFHRDRIAALLAAGADMLACETIPSLVELKSLCRLLQTEFPHSSAWISCTLRDEAHLSDGTPLAAMAKIVNDHAQIVAVGFNCIPLRMAADALRTLKTHTAKPLVVYPNSGEQWDAQKKVWHGHASGGQDLGCLCREWKALGAQLIGGCCRMTSDHIATIAKALRT